MNYRKEREKCMKIAEVCSRIVNKEIDKANACTIEIIAAQAVRAEQMRIAEKMHGEAKLIRRVHTKDLGDGVTSIFTWLAERSNALNDYANDLALLALYGGPI